MARLVYHNLAICNNQNLVRRVKMCPSGFKILAMLSRPSKIGKNTFIILPMWRNFAKSGHTGW